LFPQCQTLTVSCAHWKEELMVKDEDVDEDWLKDVDEDWLKDKDEG